MKPFTPPADICLADISADDRAALDIRLDTIARTCAYWLQYDQQKRAVKCLETTADTALMSPTSWPTHGMLQNWITALQQARALLPQQLPT